MKCLHASCELDNGAEEPGLCASCRDAILVTVGDVAAFELFREWVYRMKRAARTERREPRPSMLEFRRVPK